MDLLQTTVPWWGTAESWWAGGDGGFTDADHKGSFRSWQFRVGTKIFTRHCSAWGRVMKSQPCFRKMWSMERSSAPVEPPCTGQREVLFAFPNVISYSYGLASSFENLKSFRGFRQTRSFCPSSWNLSFHDQRWKVSISLWGPGNHVCICKMSTVPVQPRSMTWLLELQANISSADLRILCYDSWLCLTHPASASQPRENLKSGWWVI